MPAAKLQQAVCLALFAVLLPALLAGAQSHCDDPINEHDCPVRNTSAAAGASAIRNSGVQTTGLSLAIARLEAMMLTGFVNNNLRTELERFTVDPTSLVDLRKSMEAQGKHWQDAAGINFIGSFSISNAKGMYLGFYFPWTLRQFYKAADPQDV